MGWSIFSRKSLRSSIDLIFALAWSHINHACCKIWRLPLENLNASGRIGLTQPSLPNFPIFRLSLAASSGARTWGTRLRAWKSSWWMFSDLTGRAMSAALASIRKLFPWIKLWTLRRLFSCPFVSFILICKEFIEWDERMKDRKVKFYNLLYVSSLTDSFTSRARWYISWKAFLPFISTRMSRSFITRSTLIRCLIFGLTHGRLFQWRTWALFRILTRLHVRSKDTLSST